MTENGTGGIPDRMLPHREPIGVGDAPTRGKTAAP